MGFLSIFKNSEINSLNKMIVEYKDLLKEEREKNKELEIEIKHLNEKIISILENKLNNNINFNDENIKKDVNIKLTPREKQILDEIIKNPNLKNKEIAKICKLTLGSFQMYKNKLKSKGFI